MSSRRALAVSVTALALILAGGWVALALARTPDDTTCANTVLEQLRSPDGAFRLVAFTRNCGATSGFSSQVSLLEPRESLQNEPGNAFIADTDHGAAASDPGGGPKVRMLWVGPRAVSIEHDVSARVFRCEPRFQGVEIKCVHGSNEERTR